MEKTYQPQKVEKKIYQFWEKGGWFTPKIDQGKKPYVITLPPPNVTGKLHLGHAMYTIEDLMIRYHRMRGEPTLWLPGFDHASIAVHSIIDRQLARKGKTRHDIGREEFLKRAKKFANESKRYIKSQLKSMGFSLDWTREAYTMDTARSKAVKAAFKKLYDQGLIYQGERIINWCPQCQTAISDLENEYREEEGKLYYIKYGPITIATTRPETMFADVAVAIHPQNKKYQPLVGKMVPLPLTNRQIPVIADEAVDPSFGTGALKITPAHDQLDFEIGQRHQLKSLVAVGFDGKLTKLTGKYAGLSVKEGRKRVVEDLQKAGFIEKIENYVHAVGHCQRCETITEPLISKQWFVKIKPLAVPAIKAVKSGKIKIIPRRFTKIYLQWLENIRDWCISRQLWWGHKIPIEGEEDVLDTWFSSGLWPFSTLGWPEKTKDYQYFYPTTLRETGYDILFFWVAREIMMALFMTGKIPYKIVYLHGLIRDKHGQKMSKSKGNILDPLVLTEKYGTDALRMALVIGNPPGTDLSLAEEKAKGYRNFANKIWNIGRFILMGFETAKKKVPFYSSKMDSKLTKEDKKIIADLNRLIQQVTKLLDSYRFDLAAEKLYRFIWHRFADQYIEYSKKRIKEGDVVVLAVLRHVYLNCLKLLHPFMPFITEEIWRKFPRKSKNPLIISKWPK